MKRILFYTIVSIQSFFLVGMAASFYLIDDIGETIRLKTLPVDPQDIFYGDYVTLRYEIEEIPEDKWIGKDEIGWQENVYVVVEEGKNGIYEVIKASNKKLDTNGSQVQLKANYEYHDQMESTYYVDYGINRYYIEDNTGEQFEQSGEMVVTVAVAPWGQKKIVSLE